ncbi:MAG: hypothetical protein V7677_20110, partial [Motiliproteus sp.]
MSVELSITVPLSEKEIAGGAKGLGLLQSPFKHLQTPGEVAHHLLTQVKPFAKYSLWIRRKKCSSDIAEIRHWRYMHAVALAEFTNLGLSSESSIVDYYAKQEECWLQQYKLNKFIGVMDIHDLRRQCRQLLLAETNGTSISTAFYINLGMLCERINKTRYVDSHYQQKKRTQRRASAGKKSQGSWHEELGFRAYFDFWIHGRHLSWKEAEVRYPEIIPPIAD